jgi:teichuronic acid biosynthesis glycosyltransferase TuaH
MGALEYELLPAVLQHCEVAMLPLRDIPANHGRSPMKYYEYRACGARIAAFASESLRRLEDDEGLFLYEQATSDGLAQAVSEALEHCNRSPQFEQPSSEQSQSWESIAQRMLDRIAEMPTV